MSYLPPLETSAPPPPPPPPPHTHTPFRQVGNEPVHLVDSGHYADVVLGMSRGLKQSDPALRVLPGVIYPFEKSLRALNRSAFGTHAHYSFFLRHFMDSCLD